MHWKKIGGFRLLIVYKKQKGGRSKRVVKLNVFAI